MHMNYALQVFIGTLVMVIIDIPVIRFVIKPTLEKANSSIVAERPNIVAALIFYVGYVAITAYILSKIPSNTIAQSMITGALLGLLAYGTYELTNKAVIKDWSWQMVVVDMIWGTTLTAVIAGILSLIRN